MLCAMPLHFREGCITSGIATPPADSHQRQRLSECFEPRFTSEASYFYYVDYYFARGGSHLQREQPEIVPVIPVPVLPGYVAASERNSLYCQSPFKPLPVHRTIELGGVSSRLLGISDEGKKGEGGTETSARLGCVKKLPAGGAKLLPLY